MGLTFDRGKLGRMSACATCAGSPTQLTYALVEHSPTNVSAELIRRVAEPHPLQLCARCRDRLTARHRRVRTVAGVAIAGIAVACSHVVAALVRAPAPVTLGLLFGGVATFSIGAALAAYLQRTVISAEIRNRIDRKAIAAAPLPSARLIP